MSFSINNNTNFMQTNNYNNLNKVDQDRTLDALSSGSKLNKSSTDAASLAISDELLALISATGQGIQNANDSIGLMQVADGALSGIEDNIQQIEQLTIKASNDTLDAADRKNIQKEIDGLLKSSDDIAKRTSYNGIKLLDGSGGSSANGTFSTQTGSNAGEISSITIGDAQTATLVGSIDITTADGRASAFDSLSGASQSLSSMRSELGAGQNQLMSSIRNSSVSQINTASVVSQLADIDFAQESANFSSESFMTQAGTFAQSQSNTLASRVSSLLA